jgi:hypothetical protein
MTLRETGRLIRHALREKHEELGIERNSINFGKAEMPSESPFIWIYPLAQKSDYPGLGKIELQLFCGVSSEDMGDALFDSFELAERAASILTGESPGMFEDSNIDFVNIFSNLGVSVATFVCYYDRSNG